MDNVWVTTLPIDKHTQKVSIEASMPVDGFILQTHANVVLLVHTITPELALRYSTCSDTLSERRLARWAVIAVDLTAFLVMSARTETALPKIWILAT